MTTSAFFSPARPSILRRLHDGPLGPYIDEYASRLVEQGLGRSTGKRTLRLIADLSRWLERKGTTVDTATGKRDYAILLLLSRLGLRAKEATTLGLDDIDWPTGQLRLRGKGAQRAVMPLPIEVGEAIADYLQHGRPRSQSRRVFLRRNAPHVGFYKSASISAIVKIAFERAGVDAPSKGAHVFRHTLATQMLRNGASLRQIGHLLRHRRSDTTLIYAKVDLQTLRSVALPWPEGIQ